MNLPELMFANVSGFGKGGWISGPSYPPAALYPPVERSVELFSEEGQYPLANAAQPFN